MSRWHVLVGEGIECEKESARFLRLPNFQNESVEWLRLQDLLSKPAALNSIRGGDHVFLPGGFSYADHFGSGRLLAFELKRIGFFEHCEQKGVSVIGVCNGFQILTEAGVFGRGVRLLANKGFGFTNRWVRLRGEGPLAGQEYSLSVRHGEGQLTRLDADWEDGVTPFLTYIDDFDNGSVDRVAGLIARRGNAQIVGMMPHPEVSMRLIDSPNALGPEFPAETRTRLMQPEYDGFRLMKALFGSNDKNTQKESG